MRRRWKALVVVGAVAVSILVWALLQPGDPSTNLEWLRRHGAKEIVVSGIETELDPPQWNAMYRFEFGKPFSQNVRREFEKFADDPDVPAGYDMRAFTDATSITIMLGRDATWIEEKWTKLMNAMGVKQKLAVTRIAVP
jgi:hypothetical protein